jgi:hypothetical protein
MILYIAFLSNVSYEVQALNIPLWYKNGVFNLNSEVELL